MPPAHGIGSVVAVLQLGAGNSPIEAILVMVAADLPSPLSIKLNALSTHLPNMCKLDADVAKRRDFA
jgi:hypothetical protein